MTKHLEDLIWEPLVGTVQSLRCVVAESRWAAWWVRAYMGPACHTEQLIVGI